MRFGGPPTRAELEADTIGCSVDERIDRFGANRFMSIPFPILFSEHSSFWQEPEFIDMIERMKQDGSQFFTFEQEVKAWTQGQTGSSNIA